jgi:hypothetical protein
MWICFVSLPHAVVQAVAVVTATKEYDLIRLPEEG